ncbi:MAG TPA: hypothetical protein VFU88_13770 [Ktedonobacterales bacterium]|nr:hypothetical protein [Ktedonobacterales bacterium]
MRFPRSALGFLGVLLCCASLAACGGSTVTQSATVPTAAPATPTPTSQTESEWRTYTNPHYGFRLDVPAVLTMTLNQTAPDQTFSGQWQYNLAAGPAPAAQAIFAETVVNVFASTQGTRPCKQGSPTNIGAGVRAYVGDTFGTPTPAPGHGVGGPPQLFANAVVNGLYVGISLSGSDTDTYASRDAFLARYGAIWQAILASFAPGSFSSSTNPCS